MTEVVAPPRAIAMDALDRLFASDNEDDALPSIVPDLDLARVDREARAKARASLNIPAANASEVTVNTSEASRKRKDRDEDEDDEGGKKRKPLPKIDAERLLGPYGFQALIDQTKNFKPKGKGHEKEDLNRVMTIYQLWAHRMFPKRRFIDTAERVEKVCRSRGMAVALSSLKDNTLNPDKAKNSEPLGEAEEVHSDDEGNTASRDAASSENAQPSSEPPMPSKAQGEVDEDDEAIWAAIFDRMKSNSTSTQKAVDSVTVSSGGAQQGRPASTQDDEDALLDELIRDNDAADSRGPTSETVPPMTSTAPAVVQTSTSHLEEDEDALWAELMRDEPAAIPAARQAKTASPTIDEEEELLRILDEAEGLQSTAARSTEITTTATTLPNDGFGPAEHTTPTSAPAPAASSTADDEDLLRITDEFEKLPTGAETAESHSPFNDSAQKPVLKSAADDDWDIDDLYK